MVLGARVTDRAAARGTLAARVISEEPLPRATLARLRALARQPWTERFYLAGSAGLALHIAHRRPHGLDLMGERSRLLSPERREVMGHLTEEEPAVQVETARDGYLDLRFPEDVSVRLYHYPYPLVEPTISRDGLAVSSAVDLALMKLGAIISRGARRDFVDLFLLCHQPDRSMVYDLDHVLARAGEKFPRVRDFPLQALKGLADRGAARDDPMPRTEVPVAWSEVEAWIDGEVRQLARRWIGLDGGL